MTIQTYDQAKDISETAELFLMSLQLTHGKTNGRERIR